MLRNYLQETARFNQLYASNRVKTMLLSAKEIINQNRFKITSLNRPVIKKKMLPNKIIILIQFKYNHAFSFYRIKELLLKKLLKTYGISKKIFNLSILRYKIQKCTKSVALSMTFN